MGILQLPQPRSTQEHLCCEVQSVRNMRTVRPFGEAVHDQIARREMSLVGELCTKLPVLSLQAFEGIL